LHSAASEAKKKTKRRPTPRRENAKKARKKSIAKAEEGDENVN
jgi:hypothetical protein